MTPPLQSSEWLTEILDWTCYRYADGDKSVVKKAEAAILKKFEEAQVEATRIIAAIVEQEGGEYVIHKSTLVSLPRNITLERSDNEPGKDGIVYRTKRLDSLRQEVLACEDCGNKDFNDWTLLPHELFNETCPGGNGYLCLDCFCKRRLNQGETHQHYTKADLEALLERIEKELPEKRTFDDEKSLNSQTALFKDGWNKALDQVQEKLSAIKSELDSLRPQGENK